MIFMKTPSAETVIIALASISKSIFNSRFMAKNSNPSVNIHIPNIDKIAPRTSKNKIKNNSGIDINSIEMLQ